ncbi:MAG: hypothetical protein LBT81_01975 [Helicobacteraceae bacterium]|jgi:hypothetical protein|nr:hypothetical protein [Helicobacteraceae bacterium]
MRKLSVFMALVAALVAAGQSVWIDLNGNDLEGGYELSSSLSSASAVYYGIEAIRAEDEYEESQFMASALIWAVGATPIPGLSVGLGFKPFFALIDLPKNYTVSAVSVRAGIIYTLPLVISTTVAAYYNIAPKALCISDCERYGEWRLEAALQPMDGGMIFAGFRDIDFKLDNGAKYEFNRTGYIGIRIIF